MIGKISSYENFGTVDGPGIRFVLFMGGCPLRCQYCHNPESWFIDRCKDYSVEDIVKLIEKNKSYYMLNGGVTISGGEPLVQLDFLIELCRVLKEKGYNVAVDTSGYLFNWENVKKFDELVKFVDLFLLDIKHINLEKHKKLTGVSNEYILKFARYLDRNGKKVWIRYVLVPDLTDNELDMFRLRDFIDSLGNVEKVEVLPYHNMGIEKYKKLGIEYILENTHLPTEESIKKAEEILCNR